MRKVLLVAMLASLIMLSSHVTASGFAPLDTQAAVRQYVNALQDYYSGTAPSLSMIDDARAMKQHALIRSQFMVDKLGDPYPNLDTSAVISSQSLHDNGDVVVQIRVSTSFDRLFESAGLRRVTFTYDHVLTLRLRDGQPWVIKDVFDTELDGQLEKPRRSPAPAILVGALSAAFLALAFRVFSARRRSPVG